MSSPELHSLLRRQLKRCFGDGGVPAAAQSFVDAVDAAYREFDNDRGMLERALELSSQELLQAGAEMRAVFKAIPDLLIRIGPDGSILDCKMGAVGDSAAPQPGELRRVVAPAHLAAFKASAEASKASHKITTSEYVLGGNLRARHYEARIVPVMDGQLAAFVRDITTRVREEGLRAGQNRLLEMIGNGLPLREVLDSIVAWVGQLVRGARAAIFLADPEGESLRIAIAPHLPEEFISALGPLLRGTNAPAGGVAADRRQQVVIPDIRIDPGWIPIRAICERHAIRSAAAAPILSSQQRLLGTVVLYFREIGIPPSEDGDVLQIAPHIAAIAIERERHEEELRHTVSLVTSTLESTADGILVVDNQGRVVRCNERFATLWRIPARLIETRDDEALLRHVVTQLKAPEAFLRRVHELYADRNAESFDLIEFKDGRMFERYSCPHRLDGRPIGRVWSFRDSTERVKLEEQFRQAQKMDAIGRLAGGVAHDFNNLLTVIMGNLSMVQSAQLTSSQQQAAIGDCIDATERAANLTGQLLTFSRRQPISTQDLELNRLVTNMASMLRRLIGEHINLQNKVAMQPLWVRADPGMMEQMLMNLALNARDAMRQGGELLIALSPVDYAPEDIRPATGARAGQFVRLSVTDSGTGIAPELVPRIFEPFFTTKEVGHGTGLGLATVFGIVEQHGGWIEVDSQVGVGTTMSVFLPRLAHAAGVEEKRLAAAPRGGTEAVLVVEDERAVRLLMQRVLEHHGYEVQSAQNAKEALALWNSRDGRFDLLVTDIVMPGGVSGRELANTLMKESPSLSVIYCSGYTDEVLGGAAPLRGSPNFLAKPFDVEGLLRAVRGCLDARRAPALPAHTGTEKRL